MFEKIYSTSPQKITFQIPTLDFSKCSANRWNDGSIIKSQFWNCMSSLLPNIEFCAIRSLRPLMPLIREKKLYDEVNLFCEQELAHGSHHSRFNSMHLHNSYPFLKRIEQWERYFFSLLARFLPRPLFLSFFVAVEHWTAAFSQFGLAQPDAWFENCDPTMFALWEWHAVEELAHKSVCYDVFRYFRGGYFLQIFGMLALLLLIMLPGLVLRLVYVLFCDNAWWRPSSYFQLLIYLFGPKGVLSRTLFDFFRFFNPRFKPWDIDSLPLIRAYQSRIESRELVSPDMR